MPLIAATLKSALGDIFANMPATADAAAEAMANAYADYAQLGTFGGGLPVVTSAHRDAMKATLKAAIDPPLIGLPATIAAAWASAVSVFWTAMPVAGATVGVSDGCPGASSLTGTLQPIFANLANTATSCGNGVGDALDAATKTVTATVTPPVPAAPVPIA